MVPGGPARAARTRTGQRRGARCTVLDYTPAQLDADRTVAEREGYDIDLVRADMSKPLPFADASFDLIVHPVSNCYIEEVLPVWRECARILRPGGLLMSGLDNGVNFITDDDEERIVNHLPFNPLCTSSASPASGPRSRRSRKTDGRLMPSPWGRAATEPRRRTFPYRIMPLGAA